MRLLRLPCSGCEVCLHIRQGIAVDSSRLSVSESQSYVESTSRMPRSDAICSQPQPDFQGRRRDRDAMEEAALLRSSMIVLIHLQLSNSVIATHRVLLER